MWFETKRVYLSCGSARGGTELNAFDNALRAARVADFNLIRVTSIVPPHVDVRILDPLPDPIRGRGRMLPAVYEAMSGNELGQRLTVGVGVGLPNKNDADASGVIFTVRSNESEQETRERLQSMIEEGMDEMRMVKEYEFRSVLVSELVQSKHACVFACAAFCDDDLCTFFE